MKHIFLLLALAFLFNTTLAQKQERYSRAKIYLDNSGHTLNNLSGLGLAVDHGEHKKGIYFTSDFSKSEIDRAKKAGFKVDILIDDVIKYYQNQNKKKAQKITSVSCNNPTPSIPSHFHLGSYGGFFTYTEMLAILDSMQLLYPGLISAKQAIDTFHTIEGRSIYWIRVSNNPTVAQPTKPQMLYTSVHHAREPGSLSANIYYLWYLLENYSTNPQIKTIIDNTELYFIPCVNPDGYIYNNTTNPSGGGLWRKNRRNNLDGSFGVDLNRNYGYQWGFDTFGSNIHPYAETYRGTAAFSEPETKAMKWFCSNHNFRLALNYHTYGDDLLYGWSYIPSLQTPDSSIYFNYCQYIAQFNRYRYGTPNQTVGYNTNGDSNDWMYGDVVSKPKILSLTPEIGIPTSGFYPPASQIIPDCQDNVFTNLSMASFLLPFASVTPTDHKILTNTSGYLHYSIYRLGLPDTATYTVNIIPLDSWMTVSASPKVYTGLTLAQQVNDSFSYSLSSSTPNGQLVSYVLQAFNGVYYIRDTIQFYYGKYYSITNPSTESLTEWVNYGWGQSTSIFYTPPASIQSCPTGENAYYDWINIELNLAAPVDLSHATRAYLQFYTKWGIENNSDYVVVNAAINSTGSYMPLCGKYTKQQAYVGMPVYDGQQPNWVLEEMDLNDYLGQMINIQFALHSDYQVNDKGFFFDNFTITTIQDEPQAVQPVNINSPRITTYPNPTSNYLTISVTGHSFLQPLQAKLFDCTGREVMKWNIKNPKETIDTRLLQNGLYYLKVYDNNTVLPVQKIDILK